MRLGRIKLLGPIVAVFTLLTIATIPRQQNEMSELNSSHQKDRMLKSLTDGESIEDLLPDKQEPNNKRWLTIAIPTVERQKQNYFFTMIESLLNNTRINQLDRIYVAVFLVDVDKIKWKNETEMELKRKYPYLFKIGTLKVIRPPIEIYSGFDTSFKGINITHWRIKQNYDYTFMMRYCQNMSEYYLQMEDDVITAEGYIDAIREFMLQQNSDNWICLEFSELGFIGKLYHTRDLNELTQYLMMFKANRPVDINNDYFYASKGQKYRLARLPTLFQHIGYHSSLPNRIQPLKDRFFQDKVIVYSSIGVFCVLAIVVGLLFWLFRNYLSRDMKRRIMWSMHRI